MAILNLGSKLETCLEASRILAENNVKLTVADALQNH